MCVFIFYSSLIIHAVQILLCYKFSNWSLRPIKKKKLRFFPLGFTIQQSEVIVKVLLNTTNTNMDIMYSDMITKTQQV